MTLDDLLEVLRTQPGSLEFEDVMTVIADNFIYTPCRFTNGLGDDLIVNAAGENEGSCKIFALGQLLGLGEGQTLACFGQFYREDVLQSPHATNHANIRTFMRHGWAGIHFDRPPLVPNYH